MTPLVEPAAPVAPARVTARRREPVYAVTTGLGRAAVAALGVRLRAEGAERVPSSGPAVLACNHVSFPDFVYVAHALLGSGRRVRFLCRADMWDSPAGRLLTAMRQVPVDPEAPAGAYLTARRLLGDGELVCVFPEAGISPAYVVRSLMPGAAALARETGAPLVPVTTWGGQRLWPQKLRPEDPFPRPTPVRGLTVDVRFAEPWPVPPDADVETVTRRLGEHETEQLEALQQLSEHRPRPGERAPWYPAHRGGHAPDRAGAAGVDRMPRWAVRPTWARD